MPSPAEPVPVLDYAPTPLRRPLKDRIAPVSLIVLCAILGALIQSRFQPIRYTSYGYLSINSFPGPLPPTAQALHSNALLTFAPTIIPQLQRSRGIWLTPAELTANMKVAPVPGSRLIMVAFTGDEPAQIATVVNTVINSYAAQSSGGIWVAAPAAVATAPRGLNLLYPLAGAVAGAIIGLILLFLKKHQDAHRRASLKTTK